RFPICPYCKTISYELLQSDETYRQPRSRRGRQRNRNSGHHRSMTRVTRLLQLLVLGTRALLATPCFLRRATLIRVRRHDRASGGRALEGEAGAIGSLNPKTPV